MKNMFLRKEDHIQDI